MTSSSSNSSSSKPKWIYDVFLSFAGRDTRDALTAHIYTALTQAGIRTFRDDAEIERGEEISSSLGRAIEGSRIAIVVFSERYAVSTWCLSELEKIMECQRSQGQVVIPIFNHVDPSDVRHQRGSYCAAMERHMRRSGPWHDRTFGWRIALSEVANLSGFHITHSRNESEIVEDVVRTVLTKLDSTLLILPDHPVGVQKRVRELRTELLEGRSQEDVRVVGIWGMGGLGKTTLAKAIYNEIGHQFDGRSFLANIREVSKQYNGLVILQDQLISDIIKAKNMKIPNIERGKIIIRERFPHKKALVVLDDVDSLSQLTALCASREWFYPGSVIIITTRDRRLLDLLEAEPIHRMREMDESESLELFSWHAFKQASPSTEFIELSRNVVAYCGGLPLALEVLGSYLFERTIIEWECVLSKLERIPNNEIQAKLRISYDGLKDPTEKDIFLDICCFLVNKDRYYVTQILNGCGFHAEIGIQILIERSLIKVNRNNKLGMHDLLRDMGREIIRESSPKDPEKRSRLWFHEDVVEVLMEHTGTKAIEGIALMLPCINEERLISSEAFKVMTKLRLLQLGYINIVEDYIYISKNLRWLCWHGFLSKYIPKDLYQKNLVAIDFKYSSLRLVWKEPQLLERLKILNLSHSHSLIQTPEFAKLPNLEKLILKDCRSLRIVHHSIGGLKNLLLVNLKDCKELIDLPRSIYKLKSLKALILSGCSMIDKLEEDIEQMESLTTLMADKTAMTEIPYSLARMKSLGYISMCAYEGRSEDIFPSLIRSWMSPQNIPQSHSQALFGSVTSVVSLAVQNSSLHGLSPLLGRLSKLRSIWQECRAKFPLKGRKARKARMLDALYATNFLELESSPKTSQISDMEASVTSLDGYNQDHIARPADSFNSLIIQMGVCNKVDILKEKILQGWNCGGIDDSLLPGDQFPDWFIYKGEGCSVFFKVPLVFGCCLKAMVLNAVYSSCMNNMTSQFLINILIINHTKAIVQHHKRESLTCSEDEEGRGIISSIEPGDAVEVVLNIGHQLTVNRIVSYLVYGE